MLEPTKPFREAFPAGASNSSDMIHKMSEEQVRYALWAVLVVGVGGRSDLPFVLRSTDPTVVREAREAQTILAQVIWKEDLHYLEELSSELSNMSRIDIPIGD